MFMWIGRINIVKKFHYYPKQSTRFNAIPYQILGFTELEKPILLYMEQRSQNNKSYLSQKKTGKNYIT